MRPYQNVIIWRDHSVMTMFVISHQFSDIARIQNDGETTTSHNVTDESFQEWLSFALFQGLKVTHILCTEDYQEVRRTELL